MELIRRIRGVLLRLLAPVAGKESSLLLPLEGFPPWVRQELVLVKARRRRRQS